MKENYFWQILVFVLGLFAVSIFTSGFIFLKVATVRDVENLSFVRSAYKFSKFGDYTGEAVKDKTCQEKPLEGGLCPSGFGVFTAGGIYNYTGSWKHGKQNGIGVEYLTKDVYNEMLPFTYYGWFKDNKANGKGTKLTQYYEYKGDFTDGWQNGEGRYEVYKKFVATGDWKHGNFTGFSNRIAFDNGDTYSGGTQQSMYDGDGAYTWKEHELAYYGQFYCNEMNQHGHLYSEKLTGSLGKIRFYEEEFNIIFYYGEWELGEVQGKGVFRAESQSGVRVDFHSDTFSHNSCLSKVKKESIVSNCKYFSFKLDIPEMQFFKDDFPTIQ